jgi:hypothetical protein
LITALVLVLLESIMHRYTSEPWLLIVTSPLALIPATEIAVTVLNWDVTHLFRRDCCPE